MEDEKKTRKQLLNELVQLRKRVRELENSVQGKDGSEEALRWYLDTQEVINSIMELSLKDLSLDVMLTQAIERLVAIHRFAFESMGGIFLVDDDPETLVLKASKHLPSSLHESCTKIPFGTCVCGRAALSREIQFDSLISDRHEIRYDGITPHGHYCVPIELRGEVLGVLLVYVKEGHIRDSREEEFLRAVSHTLAGIIYRKKMEETLRLSETRLAEAQRIAHLGNWDWDIVNNRLWWSDEIYRIFGLKPREFGANYEAFLRSVHPDDVAFVEEKVNAALRDKKPYSVSHRIVLPDGSERFVHGQARLIFNKDGKAIRMIGTVQDITELRKAEEALHESESELRHLYSRLISAQEEERKRISMELHDEMGQALTSILINLSAIHKGMASQTPPRVKERLAEARLQAEKTLDQMRDLSLRLWPSLLDDLGLVPALRWYVNGYTRRLDIEVQLSTVGLEDRLSPEVEVVLYRIVQEALTNIAKHAGAGRVWIRLERTNKGVTASIEDDGRGFDEKKALGPRAAEAGVGIMGIRERVASLGGTLRIESSPGHGTRLSVKIPL